MKSANKSITDFSEGKDRSTAFLPVRWIRSIAGVLNDLASNPIILQEFVKQLRSGRFFVMLAFILGAGTLAVALFWQTPNYNNYPAGRRLFSALVAGETLAALLMLPAMMAHSLIVERDRDTLPLLLATPLGPGRIILGKLLSTLGIMLLLIAATYPLIGVCLARGGVAPWEVLASAIFLIYLSFVLACFAAYHALASTTIFRAIFTTQATLFLFFASLGFALVFASGILYGFCLAAMRVLGFILPLGKYIPMMSKILLILFGGVGFIVLTSIPVWLLSQARKRLQTLEPKTPSIWTLEIHPSFQYGQVVEEEKKVTLRSRWLLREGGNPFYLRERLGYSAAHTPFTIPSWYLIALASHILFILTPIEQGRWVAAAVLLFSAQFAPIYAGTLFAGEKEIGTWDLLLTTISRSRTLLNGKMLGALHQAGLRTAAMFYPPFILAAILTKILSAQGSDIHGPTFFLLAAFTVIIGTQTLFLIAMTSYLSLRFERVNRVLLWSWILFIGYCAAPYLLAPIAIQNGYHGIGFFLYALSPLHLILSISSLWETHWEIILIYFFVFMAGGGIFYRLSLHYLKNSR
ncbi:MAG: ABC transporter permease [Candidatus Omnitrophota bacterium]